MAIPLSKPVIDEEMIDASVRALQNEFLTLGESVYKFEEEFAKYIGTKYAISVNSGTFALFSSLVALGIERGKTVLTTPMSFIATANSILHAGGKPSFCDIESATGNIDINLAGKIANEIAGVIVVHLYGNPCNMNEIIKLKEKDLFVVEDACQAHGATYKGKKIGSLGDVGCFSFYSTKNATVGGDGGMITTDNEEIAEYVIRLRDCGRVSKYEHDIIGFTARLNTINAAIGRIQLKRLDAWNERRKHIARIYNKILPKEIQLKFAESSVFHIYAIHSSKRSQIIDVLNRNSIQTGIHYPIPIHLQPIYRLSLIHI